MLRERQDDRRGRALIQANAASGRRVVALSLEPVRRTLELGRQTEGLDVELISADHPGLIDFALARIARAEIVIVDTPGVAPGDEGGWARLAMLLGPIAAHETHLLLPGTLDGPGIDATVGAASEKLRVDRLLLTHLERSAGPGAAGLGVDPGRDPDLGDRRRRSRRACRSLPPRLLDPPVSDDNHDAEEEAPVYVEEAPAPANPVDARALGEIRRWKGLGGLAGFAIAGLAAYMHGELIASVLVRALIGGIAGYMVAWVAAVTVWRRIIRAEICRARARESARAATRR